MATHVCRICGKRKPVERFDRLIRSGPYEPWNLRRCKDCTHEDHLRRYANPKARRAQMDASNRWKQQNPERHAELARDYRQRHPEKIIAQNRLNHALRKGRVVRGPCEVCGTKERVHAHHKSYRPQDWFNVRWLCYVCHKLEHA